MISTSATARYFCCSGRTSHDSATAGQQSIHSDYLTAREHEIIRHVARGLTNREIAEQLVVSTNTVRSHLDHIYEKLGVHTRTAAVAAATHNQPTAGSTNTASVNA